MPLTDIVDEFNKDNDWASESFENVLNAVNALSSAFQARSKDSELQDVSQALERDYALKAAAAKAAASAYLKSHQGSHFLEKGDRRYALCSDLLVTLESDECRPAPNKMGIGDIDDNMPQGQWLAMAAQKSAASLVPEEKSDHKAYIDANNDLDKLLSPSDDEGFIQHYAEHLQVLRNLEEFADSADSDLAVNARLYEQYFDTRIKMLSSSIYQKAKEEGTDLSKSESQRAFFSSHQEFTQEQRDKYAMLSSEMERLQKMGIGNVVSVPGQAAEYKKGRLGTKNSFIYGSFLKGSYKGNISKAAGINGRFGKIGYRYKSSIFKFSPSLSVGGVSASSSLGADAFMSYTNAMKAVKDGEPLGNGIYSQGSIAMASAYGVRAQAKVRIGSKKSNLTVVPMVEALSASAYAKVAKGTMVSVTGEGKDRKVTTKYGFAAAAQAGASLLTYGGNASISFFGIKISLEAKAYIGAATASAGAQVTTGGIGLTLGAALGVGSEFTVLIDWSGLKDKLFSLWRSKKNVAQEKKETAIRENMGYSREIDDDKLRAALSGDSAARGSSDALDSVSHFQNRLTEAADREANAKDPVYRNILHAADRASGELISEIMKPEGSKKLPELMDKTMSSAVLANMIRVQRDMGINKSSALENAIHNEAQLNKMLNQIIKLNAEQPDGQKYWSSGSDKEIADALSEHNLNRITKDIFAQAKKASAPAPADKPAHNNVIQNTGSALNFS